MTKMSMFRITIAMCLISASFFFVSGAVAVTENECVNGGGSISEGSGCKFCVGGKYDLSEITGKGKNGTTRPGTIQQTGDKASAKSGTGPENKTPADNKK